MTQKAPDVVMNVNSDLRIVELDRLNLQVQREEFVEARQAGVPGGPKTGKKRREWKNYGYYSDLVGAARRCYRIMLKEKIKRGRDDLKAWLDAVESSERRLMEKLAQSPIGPRHGEKSNRNQTERPDSAKSNRGGPRKGAGRPKKGEE